MASFLTQAGFGDRIVAARLRDSDLRFTAETQVQGLKGKPLPGKPGDSFHDPRLKRLRTTLDAFEAASSADRQATLKITLSRLLKEEIETPEEVKQWAKENIEPKLSKAGKVVVLWNRQSRFNTERNMTETLFVELIAQAKQNGMTPVLMGDPIPPGWTKVKQAIASHEAVVATGHWLKPPFDTPRSSIVNQLLLFRFLRTNGLLKAQIGMMAGGQDGPAITSELSTFSFVMPESEHRARPEKLQALLPSYRLIELTGHETPEELRAILCNQVYGALEGL